MCVFQLLPASMLLGKGVGEKGVLTQGTTSYDCMTVHWALEPPGTLPGQTRVSVAQESAVTSAPVMSHSCGGTEFC